MRPFLTLWLLFFPLWAGRSAAQDNGAFPGEILRIEDRRAPTEADLAALRRYLSHRDPRVIARALRALGRLERPRVIPWAVPLLAHEDATVRTAAAEAVAQAAQGFRSDTTSAGRGGPWRAAVDALAGRISLEREPAVLGMLALSLGRMPYAAPEEIRAARQHLLALAAKIGSDPDGLRHATRGTETLVRATWRRVPLDDAVTTHLAALVTGNRDEPTRRHALGALLAAEQADASRIALLFRSGDPESRRLAVTGLPRISLEEVRSRLLDSALADASPLVRTEALRVAAGVDSAGACVRFVAGFSDRVTNVVLMALDQLAACPGSASALAGAMTPLPGDSWHRAAHALQSLARAAPARAREALPTAAASGAWQTRMYAARAAAFARDTAVLYRLAADSTPNVREAAIAGLATVMGHAADSVYRVALAARDYQLVIGAASALAGTGEPDAAEPALLRALARISRERRETSRDARVALLTRLRQIGRPRTAAPLRPYLADFDPAVAESAAAMLTAVTGRPHRAAPRQAPPTVVTAGELRALGGRLFRVTMASGGRFDVELFVDDAPLTVARLARLVRRGYFDGLSFHRFAPNFVLQGGSPGANEYAGDGPFMRDELGARSHERGTLGVSTRGRDTGDGQIFINLVDNPRLDYDYTVFGRVVAGMDVVDAIREGDVMHRVEIRPR